MSRIASLLLLALAALGFAGCGPANKPAPPAANGHEGHHHEEGDHGGHIAEAGDKHHVEWVHDDKAHKLTIYVLDESMKKEVAVPADKMLVVVAIEGRPSKQLALPPTNEKDGKASRFEIEDEELLTAMEIGKPSLRFELDGAPIEVKLEHDHDHKH
jgi:hypothetical protein